MLAPLTKKMTDHSTRSEFAFSFFCDVCGKEWRSKPMPYSGSLNKPLRDEKLNELVWLAEHSAAYERANLEAITEFNHCPYCGKWVCQSCFIVRSHALTDFCVDCLPGDRQGQ